MRSTAQAASIAASKSGTRTTCIVRGRDSGGNLSQIPSPLDDAIVRAVGTAGKTVAFSGVAVCTAAPGLPLDDDPALITVMPTPASTATAPAPMARPSNSMPTPLPLSFSITTTRSSS